MIAQPLSQSRLSRLVLISAAGLLILGLLTLGLALRNAEAFAREEARSRAGNTIEALHADLRLSAVLGLLDEESRFRIQAGRLLVPEEVTALGPGEGDEETGFREMALRNRLDRTQAAEGLDSVLLEIEQELQRSEKKGIDRLLLLNEGAWRAANGIKVSESVNNELVQHLTATFEGFAKAFEYTRQELRAPADAAPIPLSIDRSAFLLRARAGLPAPDWAHELLAKLPPGEGEALVERAADLAPAPFARSHFENTLRKAKKSWTRKALLEEVRNRVGSLLDSKEAMYRIEGHKILLWYPGAGSNAPGEEVGEGALVDQERLLAALREVSVDATQAAKAGLLPMTWSGSLLRQPEPPSHGLAVWDGLWLLPESPTATGLGGQPWFLGLLFVVVFILLIVGLWQILGSMKRERAAMVLRSEFLTSVTHELKTPLSSIRLFTEMLADGRVANEEKRSEYHRLLAGEATRLSALVENVLDLGRMERGERSYDLRSEDFVTIVDEAVDLFRPIAEADGMGMQFDNRPGGEVPIVADRTALMQTLLNLFENARKYASSGKLLQLRLEEGEGEARLRIQDRGPGIPLAERESIFERFRRGDSQKDGSVPGVGLGLYLARRILRAHGGDLEAMDPEPGSQGACLVLHLPLDPEHTRSPSST